MRIVPVVLAMSAAIFIGLPLIGSKFGGSAAPRPSVSPLLDDARAAIRLKLKSAEAKELHLLSHGAVCGLIRHEGSDIGWAPFAYSHKLGLSVAKTWGLNQPENLNKLYGCHFLPVAYSNEWKMPFWGDSRRDGYIPGPQAI